MSSIEVEISVTSQRLQVLDGDNIVAAYRVSTSQYGCGQRGGSQCTPLGKHRVSEKFGDGADSGTVFVGREATGELWSEMLNAAGPERDWILSRILWLEGCEAGVNQGSNDEGSCDSKDRYIYIHGTSPLEPLGVPGSHGCIRMGIDDVIELYDRLAVGTQVNIVP